MDTRSFNNLWYLYTEQICHLSGKFLKDYKSLRIDALLHIKILHVPYHYLNARFRYWYIRKTLHFSFYIKKVCH